MRVRLFASGQRSRSRALQIPICGGTRTISKDQLAIRLTLRLAGRAFRVNSPPQYCLRTFSTRNPSLQAPFLPGTSLKFTRLHKAQEWVPRQTPIKLRRYPGVEGRDIIACAMRKRQTAAFVMPICTISAASARKTRALVVTQPRDSSEDSYRDCYMAVSHAITAACDLWVAGHGTAGARDARGVDVLVATRGVCSII